MEMLNDMRRAIVDEAKNFKPDVDYWMARKAASEQLQEMHIFSENFKNLFAAVYSHYAKDALRKSPFYNTKTMGKTIEKQIDWAHREAIENDQSAQFAITSQARQSIENSISKLAIVCRSGSERKCSDTFQKDMGSILRDVIRGEVSRHALLIFAGKADEEDVFSELKEARRRLSFWCRRKLQSERGRQIRVEIPILQKMDSVVQKMEPDYNSEEDIADAPNVVQVPPSPIESEDTDARDPKKTPMKKTTRGKKQGGRDIGKKKKRYQS